MGRSKSRRAGLIALAIVALIAIHDYTVPHGRGFAARGALFLIDEYRAHISPHLRGRVTCRFQPTCSAYGRAAIAKYGFGKGSALTAWRIARCGPWTKQGTVDKP
ncbi:MAG TPA: membrane protein insertion efficiency factor YidD [Thermoanaerobaculia bacterium]